MPGACPSCGKEGPHRLVPDGLEAYPGPNGARSAGISRRSSRRRELDRLVRDLLDTNEADPAAGLPPGQLLPLGPEPGPWVAEGDDDTPRSGTREGKEVATLGRDELWETTGASRSRWGLMVPQKGRKRGTSPHPYSPMSGGEGLPLCASMRACGRARLGAREESDVRSVNKVRSTGLLTAAWTVTDS